MASFPNCISLKRTASLALYENGALLQTFSYILIITLKIKNEITVKLNFELIGFSAVAIILFLLQQTRAFQSSLLSPFPFDSLCEINRAIELFASYLS